MGSSGSSHVNARWTFYPGGHAYGYPLVGLPTVTECIRFDPANLHLVATASVRALLSPPLATTSLVKTRRYCWASSGSAQTMPQQYRLGAGANIYADTRNITDVITQ